MRDCFPPQHGLNFQDIRICFKVLGRKVKKVPHDSVIYTVIRYYGSRTVDSSGMFLQQRKE